MKRKKVPGIVNIIKVNQPEEIAALAQDSRIDRQFSLRTCPINGLLLLRWLAVLSFNGRRFPTMVRRDSAKRQEDRDKLWNSLNEKIPAISNGPEELEAIANWVRGVGADAEIGMLVQQLLGRLFSPDFVASEESWSAAQMVVAAPRSRKIFTVLGWFIAGKLGRSKRLLAGMVGGDLSAMNAIGIAVHNVVKGIRHMRSLYADRAGDGRGSNLSPQEAAERCLFAPYSLYRQATAPGELGGCPFSKNSLFILEIGEASQGKGGRPLVFMDDTWSQCPAARWVPAMLAGVWRRAIGDLEKNRS
jgi:hypothetical protein